MSINLKRNFRFINWARNQTCTARTYYQPRTEQEIINIINEARAKQQVVRVVGAGHSWTDIACSPDILINLDKYNRVLAVDTQTSQITVEAGIRLRDLVEVVARYGMSLRNIGDINAQSLAGVISTGTHGTGARLGNIATQVQALRLVTGRGEVVELSLAKDAERFLAARVSLGALGVISTITLQCEPAFNLAEQVQVLPFRDALEHMPELVKQHEFVKFWWLPHVDMVRVHACDRTEKKPTRKAMLLRWFDKNILYRLLFPVVLWTGKVAPFLIPTINRWVVWIHFRPRTGVLRSDVALTIPMPPKHMEAEYAVPVSSTREALLRLHALIDQKQLRIGFVTEVRFVAGDDAYLSPAYQRDSSYIGIYSYWGKSLETYLVEGGKLLLNLGGRPHWGKMFYETPETIRNLYPAFEQFNIMREEFDPEGIFENDFIRRFFQSSPSSSAASHTQ